MMRKIVCMCVNVKVIFNLFLEGPFKNNLISAASSSNAYSKTYTGVDEAGKRLADEVSLQVLCSILCVKSLDLQGQF